MVIHIAFKLITSKLAKDLLSIIKTVFFDVLRWLSKIERQQQFFIHSRRKKSLFIMNFKAI